MDGNPCVELPNSDPSDDNINDLTMVGKIVSEKVINFTAINAILTSSWNLGSNVQINALDKNLISCTFSYAEDRDKVLNAGPWAVKGSVLNLVHWPPHLHLDEIDFTPCAFWVQIHNLPRNKMNLTNANKLADFIGKFLKMDEDVLRIRIRKFIRVQVLVNSTESLKPGCMINRDDGSQSWVSFKYERMPEFCYQCGMIDHVERACSRPRGEASKTEESCRSWGPWMRTYPVTPVRTPVMRTQTATGKDAETTSAHRQPTHIHHGVEPSTVFLDVANPRDSQKLISDGQQRPPLPRKPPSDLSKMNSPPTEILKETSIHNGLPLGPHNFTLAPLVENIPVKPFLTSQAQANLSWPKDPEISEVPPLCLNLVENQNNFCISSEALVFSAAQPQDAGMIDNSCLSQLIPTRPPRQSSSGKRKDTSAEIVSKRSKHCWENDVDKSFANLQIQFDNSPQVERAEHVEMVNMDLSQETTTSGGNVAVVRRRFIHVKRLARMAGRRTEGSEGLNLSSDSMASILNQEAGVAGFNLPHPHK